MLILVVLIALYGILILSLSIGDKHDRPKKSPTESEGLSVIIPFKNEKQNLERLIREIGEPNLIQRPIEFIFIDDHSTDGGSKLIGNSEFFRLIDLPLSLFGKKAAIRAGIDRSKFDTILTLDADVCLKEEFFDRGQFIPSKNRMLLIHSVSPVKRHGLTPAFFDLEFISLQIFGRRMAQWGFPVLSNGACLSFRKKAFYAAEAERSDYSLPTGDDVFLTEAVASVYGSSAIEPAREIPSIRANFSNHPKDLLHQRARWISKTTDLGSYSFRVIAFLVALVHISFLPTAIFYWASGEILSGLILILMKSGAEWIVFSKYLNRFGRRDLMSYIFLSQLIYPVYICLLLPLGWVKRRSYKTQNLHVGSTV